jgi:hypothetical protein
MRSPGEEIEIRKARVERSTRAFFLSGF